MSRSERLVQWKEQTGAISDLKSQVCTQKFDSHPRMYGMHAHILHMGCVHSSYHVWPASWVSEVWLGLCRPCRPDLVHTLDIEGGHHIDYIHKYAWRLV